MAVPRNSNYTVYTALQGTGANETINSIAVIGYLADKDGNLLIATGTTVPTNGSAGYAKGCMFIDTDVGAGTGATYLNKGTTTSSNFTLVTQA
jgi:hypothetical protein